MRNQEKEISRVVPEPHEFVVALQGQKSNSKLVKGFIGNSENENYLRVYLDVELKRFVDILKEDIRHFEDYREKYGSTSSVILWVSEKAEILHFGNWYAPEDPTTMATGEEGGDPTTMATGEESGMPFNPMDEVVNPFGRFI